MANLTRFFADVLRSRGLPVTKKNLQFMSNWQRYEGGWTNNSATFNPMNSTQGQGASINGVGVKAYPNYKYGVQMTGDTIFNGNYPDIVAALRSGNPYAHDMSRGLSTWVAGPNAGIQEGYVRKVTGGRGAVGRVPQSPRAPSGVVQQPSQARKNQRFAAANSMLGVAMSYAQTGRINNNQLAKALGAVSKLGTVEPPSYKTAKAKQRSPMAAGAVDKVLAAAHDQVGKPYVFGSGPSTESFDCSDLVQWAYKQIGVEIPRTTYDQVNVGTKVNPKNRKAFKPGDLIFPEPGHVVMYVGGGKVIAAPHTGTVVQYQPLSRWSNIWQVRRIVN